MSLPRLWRRKADDEIIEQEIAQAEVIPEPPRQSHGGVRKQKHKQFSMDEPKGGGRVVKVMPRKLRQMKDLAEKTDE